MENNLYNLYRVAFFPPIFFVLVINAQYHIKYELCIIIMSLIELEVDHPAIDLKVVTLDKHFLDRYTARKNTILTSESGQPVNMSSLSKSVYFDLLLISTSF